MAVDARIVEPRQVAGAGRPAEHLAAEQDGAAWAHPIPMAPSSPPQSVPDGSARRTAGTRALVVLVLVAALVGLVAGGAIAWLAGGSFSAAALVQGAPAQLDPRGADEADARYAQTEVAYAGIDSAEMRAEVQRRTGVASAVEAEVSVLPGTTLLQFTGRGQSADQAVEAANASAEIYVDLWRKRTGALLSESLAILDAQLAATGQTDLSRTAQLQEQRSTLRAELDAVATTKRIIKPAGEAERSPVYASGAVLGGMVGALAGVCVALWRRQQ